jgi:CRISPR/Cas system-associated protein Cas10 (large subunit of type III CRISPR-Cas system)
MLHAPGIALFQITDPFGADCESCGCPLDRGDFGRWDDRHEIMTCSRLCAMKARARLLRILAEVEQDERTQPVAYSAPTADLFDGMYA